MTVVLNPYPGLPAQPPARTPVARPGKGEPAVDSGFGNIVRGLIYPCAGAPGFLQSVAPDEKPGASSPALAADVFNQNGFFGHAVPADEQMQPDRELASERPVSAGQTPSDDTGSPAESGIRDYWLQSDLKPGAPTPSPPADAPIISPEVVASAWAPGSTRAEDTQSALPERQGSNDRLSSEVVPIRTALARTSSSAVTEVTAGGKSESGYETPSAIQTVSFRARLAALLPRLFAQDSAALNARVSVQAVEHGLHVVAKLNDLGLEERIRLRDRIAATLSRHGLVGREITLNGDKDMGSGEGNH
ncbi:MAG: hypothetical protein ABI240_05500 [Sphingomonas sp.]